MMSRNNDRQYQLSQFARAMNLSSELHPIRKQIPGRPSSWWTNEDRESIMKLLESAKERRNGSLSRFQKIVSGTRRETLDHEEISAQLLWAVRDGQRPGLVEVLRDLMLEQGGDINYCRKKQPRTWQVKIRKVTQFEERSMLLAIATTKSKIDLVQLLAPSSDQTSLDESLHIALNTSPHTWNVIILELLLAHNADASQEATAFRIAIEARNVDVVGLLLNAPKPISQQHVSHNLWSAVKLGFLDILFLLVVAGAEGNDQALREAARAGRLDLLVAITLCHKPPPPGSLDEAIEIVGADTEAIELEQRLWMMDVLLSNGARGPGSDSTLIKITMKVLSQPEPTADPTLHSMMRLLIRHDASIDYKNGTALKSCVFKNRIDLVEILLAARDLDTEIASEAFALIDFTDEPETKVKMAKLLLGRGVQGTPLHEALIQAVKTNHLGAVEMLVLREESNRASINYCRAQALQDAVCREKQPIVEVLLTANPTLESLGLAFRQIRNANKQGRLWLTRVLLRQGVDGDAVDESLSAAIADETPMRDERLIQLLVEAGARIDQHLEAAVEKGDELLLRILLKGQPSTQAVSEALLASLNMPGQEKRSRTIGSLLDAGADVNYQGGRVILRATKYSDLNSLDMFLKTRPRVESLKAAFFAATAIGDFRVQHEICRKLIEAGATGDEVNEALVRAVDQESENTELLQLLVPNASVDYDCGRALCLAVKHGSRRNVSLLLQRKLRAATFQNAFKVALAVEDERLQLVFCRMLLQAGPEDDNTYSPIEYAEKRLCHDCETRHPRLLELLMYYQAKDRYRKNQGEELLDIINSRPVSLVRVPPRPPPIEEEVKPKMDYRISSVLPGDIEQYQTPLESTHRSGQTRGEPGPDRQTGLSPKTENFDSERAARAIEKSPSTSKASGQENETNMDQIRTQMKNGSSENRVKFREYMRRGSAVTMDRRDSEEGDKNEARQGREILRLRPVTSYGQLANRSRGRKTELDS